MRGSYLDVEIDSYTEGGSAATQQFNLRIGDQEFDSLIGELGARISTAISLDFGVIVPQLQVAYRHEFKNDAEKTKAAFVSQAGSPEFTISTRDGDEDYFTVGLGASAVMKGGLQAFVNYETVLGLEDLDNHIFTVGVRTEF